MECAHCHAPLEGRRRVYCDRTCRQAAWRRRRAGLREDELAGGGRRGRVALDGHTRAEERQAVEQLEHDLAEILATVTDRIEASKLGIALLAESWTTEAKRRLREIDRRPRLIPPESPQASDRSRGEV